MDSDPAARARGGGRRQQRRLRRREPARGARQRRPRQGDARSRSRSPTRRSRSRSCITSSSSGPSLPVIVRTVDDSEIDRLLEAGATEVVPEVLEGSLMLASHSLLAARRAAESRAEAHPRDPRGALRPVPRVLPRRHRRGGRGREPAGAAAFGGAARSRVGGRPARSPRSARRRGRGHRRAPARRALAARPTPDWRVRGGRRRGAARPAGGARRWPRSGCSSG